LLLLRSDHLPSRPPLRQHCSSGSSSRRLHCCHCCHLICHSLQRRHLTAAATAAAAAALAPLLVLLLLLRGPQQLELIL
jgi:hypothetical protein